jgi:hypothetical protein
MYVLLSNLLSSLMKGYVYFPSGSRISNHEPRVGLYMVVCGYFRDWFGLGFGLGI